MATQKQTTGVIEGVLVYAKVAEPAKAYQSEDTEYIISVIVDEDTADKWDSEFKKQPAKKVRVADFENKYKFECPIAGVKNVYEIKLKRTAVKNGEPFYPENRPKVFLDMDNGDRVEITESRLIANGSVGKVSYTIRENDFGRFSSLRNVLMTEEGFKEYVSTGGSAGSEFGDEKPAKKEAPRKEATEARATKAKQKPAEENFEEDLPPF